MSCSIRSLAPLPHLLSRQIMRCLWRTETTWLPRLAPLLGQSLESTDIVMGAPLQKRMHTPIIPLLEKKSKPPLSAAAVGQSFAFGEQNPWPACGGLSSADQESTFPSIHESKLDSFPSRAEGQATPTNVSSLAVAGCGWGDAGGGGLRPRSGEYVRGSDRISAPILPAYACVRQAIQIAYAEYGPHED